MRLLHEEAGEINEELDVLEREAAESEAKLRDTARRAEETHKELMAAQDAYRAAKGLRPAETNVPRNWTCGARSFAKHAAGFELKAVAAEHLELATLLASYGVGSRA